MQRFFRNFLDENTLKNTFMKQVIKLIQCFNFFRLSFSVIVIFAAACNADADVGVKAGDTINKAAQKTDINNLKVKRKQDKEYRQVFPKDGTAVSIEPLDKSQCFGESYAEQSVRQLLNELYSDKLPISGLGLFMGVDKLSQAYKNKEFRYFFKFNDTSQQEAEQEIFDRILAYAKEFYSLLGFKGRMFELNGETKKQMSSYIDIPAIYIENVPNSPEFISHFQPFESFYWKLVSQRKQEDTLKSIAKIKQKLFLALEVQDNLLTADSIYSIVMDFSEDRFHIHNKPIKDFKLFYYLLYGYYLQNNNNDHAFTKKSINTVSSKFKQSLFSMFMAASNGSRKNIIDIKINDINTILDRQSDIAPAEIAYPFEKTLFLSIYTRIKPLNMEKQNFIDAVLKVMQPCLI